MNHPCVFFPTPKQKKSNESNESTSKCSVHAGRPFVGAKLRSFLCSALSTFGCTHWAGGFSPLGLGYRWQNGNCGKCKVFFGVTFFLDEDLKLGNFEGYYLFVAIFLQKKCGLGSWFFGYVDLVVTCARWVLFEPLKQFSQNPRILDPNGPSRGMKLSPDLVFFFLLLPPGGRNDFLAENSMSYPDSQKSWFSVKPP